jgi:hypothetical protein
MTLAYIREQYGVPAYRGRSVTVDGEPGVIVGAEIGTARIRVRLDGRIVSAHPTWRVDYESDEETET